MLPKARGRRRIAQVSEAYEALAASLRVQLSGSQRIVAVTSTHQSENRSAVAVGLGRALALSGLPTLLVSADLRRPGLHKALGVPRSPGLANVLEALADEAVGAGELVGAATRAGEQPARGELRGLASGDPSHHPAALLSGHALRVVFDELRRSEYRYVIVEAPPLLGPIDGQLVTRWADAVLVLCELDRLAPGEAAELGDVLARLDSPVLGSIVIGGGRVRYWLPAWAGVREPMA
jgi:Mrp family chromosome partitioning ATPase